MSENKCPKCGAECFPDLTLMCHSYTYVDGRFCQSLECKLRCAEQRIAELERDVKTERSHRLELQLVADSRKATIGEQAKRIADLEQKLRVPHPDRDCLNECNELLAAKERQIDELEHALHDKSEYVNVLESLGETKTDLLVELTAERDAARKQIEQLQSGREWWIQQREEPFCAYAFDSRKCLDNWLSWSNSGRTGKPFGTPIHVREVVSVEQRDGEQRTQNQFHPRPETYCGGAVHFSTADKAELQTEVDPEVASPVIDGLVRKTFVPLESSQQSLRDLGDGWFQCDCVWR